MKLYFHNFPENVCIDVQTFFFVQHQTYKQIFH